MKFISKIALMLVFAVFVISTANAENLPEALKKDNTAQSTEAAGVEKNPQQQETPEMPEPQVKLQSMDPDDDILIRDKIEPEEKRPEKKNSNLERDSELEKSSNIENDSNLKKVADSNTKKLKLYGSFTTRKYIVGPNDVINVSLIGVPDLSQESIKVQPDGKIDLAGLGNIKVAGLTLEEVRNELTLKYANYVRNPDVSVKLERSRPFIVQVTGAVNQPGSYEINTDTDRSNALYDNNRTFVERKTPILSNVLIAAGGVNYDADLEHIVISNQMEGIEYEINALEFLENGKSAQDIYLMAGDSVHVPQLVTPLAVNEKRYKKFAHATFANTEVPVRVLGDVNSPGMVNLDASLSSSLNTAIAQAGGYRGNSPYPPKQILVSRVSNDGNMVTTAVNPTKNDMTLMPNDVVYVPEKTRHVVGKVFDYMTRIVSPFTAIAGGYNNWAFIFDPTRLND